MEETDVPASVDDCVVANVTSWSQTDQTRRPWRTDMLAQIARILGTAAVSKRPRVLELGSEPGSIVQLVLVAGGFAYVALDVRDLQR